MKKKIYRYAGIMAIILFSVACSEEEIETYSGCKSGLFIQQVASMDIYGNPISFRDSISYSFADASSDVTSAAVRFYVQTIGGPVDYDRPYILEVMEGTTAEVDVDYTLDENDFVVKAHQAADTVILRLLRTPKLWKQTLRLKVGIKANEYFELPFEYYKNSSSWSTDGPMNSATTYIVNFSEKYTAPFYWRFFGGSYFGSFTTARYLALLEVMGWTMSDWSKAGQSGAKVAAGKFDFAARALQKYLQEKADQGYPVLDDDGKYLQLPAKYAVDYSKYETS